VAVVPVAVPVAVVVPAVVAAAAPVAVVVPADSSTSLACSHLSTAGMAVPVVPAARAVKALTVVPEVVAVLVGPVVVRWKLWRAAKCG
jgi:hypothetical protein